MQLTWRQGWSSLCTWAWLLLCPVVVFAQPPALQWGVYDASGSQVWASTEHEEPHPIASLTKLMTAYVVLQHPKAFDYVVTILPDDTHAASTTVLRSRDQVTVRELLYLMMIASDNVAARALARAIASSRDAFVFLMNQDAQLLGMRNTTYVDPSGLLVGNQSTPRDLAQLTIALAPYYHTVPELFSTKRYTATVRRNRRIQSITVNNTNRLLDATVDLSKTGYTSPAGYCLIERVDDYIVIVLGAPTRESRTTAMQILLRYIMQKIY